MVLGVLDQEHDQERHDRGAGVDDQLPRVGEAKDRPGHGPADDGEERDPERDRRADHVRDVAGDSAKYLVHH